MSDKEKKSQDQDVNTEAQEQSSEAVDTVEQASATVSDNPTDKSSEPDSIPLLTDKETEVEAKTEEQETKIEAKAEEKEESSALTDQSKGKTKTVSTWPGKVALALSLAALGASGYLYWLTLQQTQSASQSQAAIEAQVSQSLSDVRSSVDQAINSTYQKLGQLQAESAKESANIEQLQQRLTRSIQQVSATQHTNRKDWLLAEVEYLLRLANQRVLMEQTAQGALSLLKSADKILKETDDVSIYEIRKALAEDIAALEAVPNVDSEGVFLKLAALNGQVDKLRLIPVSKQHKLPDLVKEVTPEVVEESWSAGLQESWSKAVDKMSKLVIIQHRDEPIEPLLSPKQSYYLQQNLHLMLEQAQMALLQRQQGSYDASLAKAENWLQLYFEQEDSATQALLRGLSELKTVQVSPELPDISGSLNTLKGYLKEMAKLSEKGAA